MEKRLKTKPNKLTGTVVSAKTPKTVAVRITRTWEHPLYHKRLRRYSKVLAHDELGATMGARVAIAQSRPFSKRKTFVVTQILSE